MKIKPPLKRYLGLRLQLTIWYTLVFATLICCSGFLLYMHLQYTLMNSLGTELRIRAHQIADDITYDNGTLTFHNNTGELPGFDMDDKNYRMQQVNDADVNTDTLARVLDAQGHIVGVTPSFQKLAVPRVSVYLPLHHIPWQGNVSARNGQQVLVYSLALVDEEKNIAVIQVGASLTQLQAALAGLLVDFLLLAPITLCLSAIGSYVLASRAFKPVDHLIQTAKCIKEGDLHLILSIDHGIYDQRKYRVLTENLFTNGILCLLQLRLISSETRRSGKMLLLNVASLTNQEITLFFFAVVLLLLFLSLASTRTFLPSKL